MNIPEENRKQFFLKILNPFFQTDIKSIKQILHQFNLNLTNDFVIDIFCKTGLLPLDKDTLKQKRLLQIISDLFDNEYDQIAQEIITFVKNDSNLRIKINEFITDVNKTE